MKYKNINDLRKEFRQEWLLIAVGEVDQEAGTPMTGALINHGKSADELWEEASSHREPVMVLFSDDWPEDIAACFFIRS